MKKWISLLMALLMALSLLPATAVLNRPSRFSRRYSSRRNRFRRRFLKKRRSSCRS